MMLEITSQVYWLLQNCHAAALRVCPGTAVGRYEWLNIDRVVGGGHNVVWLSKCVWTETHHERAVGI
jgi:hypothetical protein